MKITIFLILIAIFSSCNMPEYPKTYRVEYTVNRIVERKYTAIKSKEYLLSFKAYTAYLILYEDGTIKEVSDYRYFNTLVGDTHSFTFKRDSVVYSKDHQSNSVI